MDRLHIQKRASLHTDGVSCKSFCVECEHDGHQRQQCQPSQSRLPLPPLTCQSQRNRGYHSSGGFEQRELRRVEGEVGHDVDEGQQGRPPASQAAGRAMAQEAAGPAEQVSREGRRGDAPDTGHQWEQEEQEQELQQETAP
jgi:hypothetical protein